MLQADASACEAVGPPAVRIMIDVPRGPIAECTFVALRELPLRAAKFVGFASMRTPVQLKHRSRRKVLDMLVPSNAPSSTKRPAKLLVSLAAIESSVGSSTRSSPNCECRLRNPLLNRGFLYSLRKHSAPLSNVDRLLCSLKPAHAASAHCMLSRKRELYYTRRGQFRSGESQPPLLSPLFSIQ
eukprot:4334032-Prymnesium_polylepis.1